MQFWQISTLCHPIVLSPIFAPAQKVPFYLKYLKTSKTSPVGGVALLINRIHALKPHIFSKLFHLQLEDAEFARTAAMKARQNAELELADVQVGSRCLGDWETISINQFYRSVYTTIHSNTLKLHCKYCGRFVSVIDCVSRFNLRTWAEVSRSWTKRTSGITVVYVVVVFVCVDVVVVGGGFGVVVVVVWLCW